MPTDPSSVAAVDIIYAISDGEGGEDTATATFSVTPYEPPNQPPVADDDFYPGTVVAGETITIDAATLLANDYDPDGDHSNLQVTSVTLLSGDGEFVDNGNGTWTITPAVDFVGDASLSYTVEDADGGTSTATATITVTPYVAPNEPPVADDSVTFTMAEDGTLLIEEAALLGSSSDPDNDALHIENLELGEGASGSLTLNDVAAPEGNSDMDVCAGWRL